MFTNLMNGEWNMESVHVRDYKGHFIASCHQEIS
jgi:hypothetical protein